MYLHRVFKMYQSFVTATHVFIGKRKFDVSPQSIKMYQSFVTATHVFIGKRKFDVSPQSIQNVSIICNSNPCVHWKEEV